MKSIFLVIHWLKINLASNFNLDWEHISHPFSPGILFAISSFALKNALALPCNQIKILR